MESIPRLPLCNQLLQQTLRGVCLESEWSYCVFWRILPRNFPPPKWELGGYLERSKANKRNWILVWEDGFCDFARSRPAHHAPGSTDAGDGEFIDSHTALPPELFFKMSHEIYNYGEGLMGKVAADNGAHKWIYRDPPEHDSNRLVSFWHNTIDPQPRTWEAQFKCGIQTIVVVAVHEGLVQLGASRQILEDLNLVVTVQRKFNGLQEMQALSPACTLVSPDYRSAASVERKMKHARSPSADYDEEVSVRSVERRLSWNTWAPPPPAVPLSPHYDRHILLPLPMARDVRAAADHLSNNARPAVGLHPWQSAVRSQANYHADQLKTPICSDASVATSSTCAVASTSYSNALLNALPSVGTLQVLLSKLQPAGLALSDQQSVSGKSAAQDYGPLLQSTVGASAPARSSISSTAKPTACSSDVLPDSACHNIDTASCDVQLPSFHARTRSDGCPARFATLSSPEYRQHKTTIKQADEADTRVVDSFQSRDQAVDHDFKGMVELQSREPAAPELVLQRAEEPEHDTAATDDYQ